MKKLVFIIPYFGKFNNYFQLFLNSCSNNKEVDWIIYTDDETKYNYPENVKVKYTSFEKIKGDFQKKIPYKIKLTKPYKLCDFKPLYGYLFKEDIENYECWGHCDSDMIWGDIKKFVFPKLNEGYDKLFFLGHCSIFKNSEKYLTFIKEKINSKRFKEVFQIEKNNSFDEEFKDSINTIMLTNDFKIYLEELEANIYMKSSNFHLTKYNFDKKGYEVIKRKNSVFIYDDGKIKQYYIENGKIQLEEFLYIHMQSRKMEVKISKNTNFYKIIPNTFELLEFDAVTNENFKKIKNKNFNLHYFKLRSSNLKIKIINYLKKGS